MQAVPCSVYVDQFVTLGYFVGTELEVGLRAVPLKPQAVLVVVGAFSAGSTFMMYHPVYEARLDVRLSLVWMMQFG